MLKILERELSKLESKMATAERNYHDTGNGHYWNTMQKCEKQISEIQRLVELDSMISTIEGDHKKLLVEIRDQAKSLRQEYRFEDGIARFSNWIDAKLKIYD
jgi:hypothetical protein